MKQFLIKLVAFFGISGLLFFIAIGIFYYRVNNFSFKLSDEKKSLFIGDSHFEVGIDEAQIPGSYNFAKSADCYLNAFLRSRKILNANPNLKTLFITVTPHSLAKYGDGRIYRPTIIIGQIPYYFPLHTIEEQKIYWQKVPLEYVKDIVGKPFSLARNSFLISEKNFLKNLGCSTPSENKILEKDINGGFVKRIIADDSYGNEIQLRYLHKIVDFAKEKDVKVIFVNTPIYKAEKYFDLPFYYSTIQREFPDIPLWDYVNWECPDDFRQDINHLNKWGAEAFSKVLAERMKREGIISD